MITRREELWLRKYNEMREYILRVHHLPDKKKKENSVLVNWWKYNKKRFKQGLLSEEKAKLLKELSDMRLPGQTYFTGKRPRKVPENTSTDSQASEETGELVTQEELSKALKATLKAKAAKAKAKAAKAKTTAKRTTAKRTTAKRTTAERTTAEKATSKIKPTTSSKE